MSGGRAGEVSGAAGVSGAADAARHTVLVVDDTASKRYITSSWLRRAGHRVVEAATGSEALERAARGGVDLVVLDVHLPDLDGLEVCRRLKTQAVTAAVPVLHISAIAIEVEDRSAGLDHGADAYLADPIEPRELLSTVGALLRHYDARRSAERLAARLGRLSTATLRINAALSVPRLLAAAAEGAADVLEAPTTVVALGDDGTWVSASARPGAPGARRTTVAAELVAQLLAPLREVSRVVVAEGGPWAQLVPTARAGAACSVTVVRDRLDQLAVAVVVEVGDSSAADEDALARQLGLVVGVALENRRTYAEEHRIALTLQRSLLPAALPVIDGLEVAARYNASGDQVEVGGDFFDAFELEDGTAVLAIGDVQGHSLQAATIMAELRHSLRAYAHEGHGAAALVARLNQVVLREHPEHTATVCVLFVDPTRRTASVVNAGHVPPLLSLHGRATFLEECVPLLGVELWEPVAVEVALEPGVRVVLVTDGLVERRTASLDDGLDALVRVVLAHDADDLAALADAVMRELGRGSEDDTALVAVQTDPPQTDPPQTDPPQTDPPQTDPPQTDPPQTDPPQEDP